MKADTIWRLQNPNIVNKHHVSIFIDRMILSDDRFYVNVT